MDRQIGFVGAGVMASVMLDGLLADAVVEPEQIIASDPNEERRQRWMSRGARAVPENAWVAEEADLLVLAVKPQTLGSVLPQLAGRTRKDAVVVSIVAGAATRTLQRGLRHDAVVRCMPNLPCRIRQGMTVWTAAPAVTPQARADVQRLLGVMGEALEVTDEADIDRATAVSGSGPAIVGAFVQAMLDAATFVGESRSVAHDTVLATVLGTAEMIRQAADDNIHVAQLIDEVTSPGGTTSRALQVLKRGGFAATLTDAVSAAYDRTTELGEGLNRDLEARLGGEEPS